MIALLESFGDHHLIVVVRTDFDFLRTPSVALFDQAKVLFVMRDDGGKRNLQDIGLLIKKDLHLCSKSRANAGRRINDANFHSVFQW